MAPRYPSSLVHTECGIPTLLCRYSAVPYPTNAKEHPGAHLTGTHTRRLLPPVSTLNTTSPRHRPDQDQQQDQTSRGGTKTGLVLGIEQVRNSTTTRIKRTARATGQGRIGSSGFRGVPTGKAGQLPQEDTLSFAFAFAHVRCTLHIRKSKLRNCQYTRTGQRKVKVGTGEER